jgi:phosphatidylinositol glycan class W
MTKASLKADKEAFVTGHDGTTPWEILLVCLSVVTSSAMYGEAAAAAAAVEKQERKQQRHSILLLIVVEAIGVWFPLVLTQTTFLYPWGIIVMGLQLAVAFGLRRRRLRHQQSNNNSSAIAIQELDNDGRLRRPQHPRLEYLTLYRSSIMYLTFVAILAVDFHAFPRRFCKTEINGYGLMDVGAASFCISAGFVSQRARSSRYDTQQQQQKKQQRQRFNNMFKPLLHTVPLIVIGLIRIIANQELDYQEHVSEYGVHWNFFFTMGVLALVPPLVSMSSTVSSQRPTLTFPMFLMSFYQWLLNESGGDWQSFIEDAPRQCTNDDFQQWSDSHNKNNNSFQRLVLSLTPTLCNFVTANREGILGCIGYLSLYFSGEFIGYHWIWKSQEMSTKTITPPSIGNGTNNRHQRHEQDLGPFALVLWTVHLVLVHGFRIPVSRRSTNISFCTWALAHNVLLLYFLQQLTSWSKTRKSGSSGGDKNNKDDVDDDDDKMVLLQSHCQVPIVWEKVNSYGLVMFLIANLLTGLVNLTIPTLEVDDVHALIIVYVYICLVGAAAVLLDAMYGMYMHYRVSCVSIWFYNS